jgi:hypothetical protein
MVTMTSHPHRDLEVDPTGEDVGRAWVSPQMIVGMRQPQPLPDLLMEIQQARADLRDVRHRGGPAPVRLEQRHLFYALHNYTAALTASRLPVPYAIRDEVRIYRVLLTTYED